MLKLKLQYFGHLMRRANSLVDRLKELVPKINKSLCGKFRTVKKTKKKQLCAEILKKEGVVLDPDMVFDHPPPSYSTLGKDDIGSIFGENGSLLCVNSLPSP